MPLAMSRPWKHPKTGIYWLRKGVPEDLRKLVDKREEKRSLQTRDPVEAKRRHAEALAEIEARWANLRAGPKALTAFRIAVTRQVWQARREWDKSYWSLRSPTRSLWLIKYLQDGGICMTYFYGCGASLH
jgi:hypothetical protein